MGARVVRNGEAPAMRSPVSWALLGLVIERPSYGYELVQRFERTYGDALELRSLIEKLPTEESVSEIVRQPKPHYRASAEGVTRYQDWLIAQVHEERRRSRLFARQLAVLEPHEALAVVDRYEQACLQEAKKTPISSAHDPAVDRSAGLAGRLVCEEDRLAVGARLSWIEYARREFKALAGRPSSR